MNVMLVVHTNDGIKFLPVVKNEGIDLRIDGLLGKALVLHNK